ncbi:helix-turn-helix domain-containing protein [Thermoanaerobacterium sp. DL9XJH110]|uniref:helix-turn-helix domain-containing protein n=1 Tax=Thermoanaerobacterium sp. DL9XJH110 TaxID=3386643 RepID=UPI003BB7CFE9
MVDEIFKDIGKKIRHIRLKQNLTQEELGEKANLHYSYIGQMERGDKVPSLKTLNKIAKALNVSLDYVLEGTKNCEESCSADDSISELIHLLKSRPPKQMEMLISIFKTIIAEFDKYEKIAENEEK